MLLQNVRPGQGSCNIWAGPILEAGLLQRGHLSKHRPSSVQRQFSSGFVLAACVYVCSNVRVTTRFSTPPRLPKIKLESFSITLSLVHSVSLAILRYLTLFEQWQHVSLTFCRQRCVLKAEQFFGAKLRRRRRSGDSRPPGALWCGSAADFPPFLHVFIFLLSTRDHAARENVFNLL